MQEVPTLQSKLAPSVAPRPLLLDNLPVFPAVALQLINLMDQPESSVHEITDLLRREPALSAEVLRFSNSARYIRHKEQIVDLDTALVVIGLSEARRVSLNAAVRGMIGGALGLPELRHCWTHCIAVATVAEELAPDHGEREGPAYVAGLLHDLGMLALLSLYPSEYRQMLLMVERDEMDWRDGERNTFGWDHEEVGALLVATMGLPASLKSILDSHHDCSNLSQPGMLPLIATADRIADSIGFRVGGFPSQEAIEALIQSMTLANPKRQADEFDRLRDRILAATN